MEEATKPPEPKRARFIEDCNQAQERDLYQFLRHLTQGFRWDSSEWCRTCLLDAWAWRKLAMVANNEDPELYHRFLDESGPEVVAFLARSKEIRERHEAKRQQKRQQKQPPKPQDPPKKEPVTPPTATVPTETRPTKNKEREQERAAKTPPAQPTEQTKANEPSTLAAGKTAASDLLRWFFTGPPQ